MQVADGAGFGIHFRSDPVGFAPGDITFRFEFQDSVVKFAGAPLAYENRLAHGSLWSQQGGQGCDLRHDTPPAVALWLPSIAHSARDARQDGPGEHLRELEHKARRRGPGASLLCRTGLTVYTFHVLWGCL